MPLQDAGAATAIIIICYFKHKTALYSISLFLCYRFEDIVVAAQLSHIWRYLPTGRFLFSSGEDPRDKPLRAVRRVFVTPTPTTTEMIVFSTKHVTAKYEIIIIIG